eukprot:470187-Pleurochrysis_carterae.AAC.2
MGDRHSANISARGGRRTAALQRGHGRRGGGRPRSPMRWLVAASFLQGLTGGEHAGGPPSRTIRGGSAAAA